MGEPYFLVIIKTNLRSGLGIKDHVETVKNLAKEVFVHMYYRN